MAEIRIFIHEASAPTLVVWMGGPGPKNMPPLAGIPGWPAWSSGGFCGEPYAA